MILLIDFDGTCVTHEFPLVGKEIGAAEVLKEITDAGHKLILFTMRSHKKEGVNDPNQPNGKLILETDVLDDAINWFKKHDIPLWGINENPDQKTWTDSPKPYGHIIIDDIVIGCPLIYPKIGKPYVDWKRIKIYLKHLGII